jgi:hypothetical protein
MSALGHWLTSSGKIGTTALHPKADMLGFEIEVR